MVTEYQLELQVSSINLQPKTTLKTDLNKWFGDSESSTKGEKKYPLSSYTFESNYKGALHLIGGFTFAREGL